MQRVVGQLARKQADFFGARQNNGNSMGTIFGPVVGAFIVVALQHVLSGIGSWVQVVIGGTFIACVLLFRRGVVGELARLLRISSL